MPSPFDCFGENFVADQKQELPIVPTKETCKNAVFIITGANVGLGYEAAKHFVALNSAKVILAVRSPANGEEAKKNIEAETGVNGIAEVWPLDMGSSESIRTFAKRANELERLDAVVENAGVALHHWSVKDGNEETMMVNVLGTILLGALVMPKLQETGKKFGVLPHLSFVGSGAGFIVPGALEQIDGDVFDWLNDESRADMKNRYPLSKLVELYAVREYASRNPVSSTGVVINYVNPGACKTDLTRNADEETKGQIDALNDAVGRTAEVGSRTLLHGAVGGEETHGKYLSECVPKEDYIPSWITDESGQKIQKAIWESLSGKLNKIVPGVVD
ncbi:NAD(P)-binding protein [Tothia fuscella]|uniref:NAD(P)-binding protein n=1 Tax=Tothia fuscella TaxID=1048955 RepID=A0A9P4TYX0_9PEZI|nr:NAD(P)-binding protein [Tothia fuscella]